MSLTDKLFSFLGFAKPLPLKRFDNKAQLPENIFLLSISERLNINIEQALSLTTKNIVKNVDNITIKTVEALVIDATDYIDENSYQHLYSTVKSALKHLTNNAKVLVIGNTISTENSDEENTFNQALIGFSKSLAKELGRKASTTNMLFINKKTHNLASRLSNPIQFFLSNQSSFVSGQMLTISKGKELIAPSTINVRNKKTAIVTGAAQGIGAAIATRLSNEGYLVIGIDIEPMKAQLINNMKRLQGESFILDVSSENAGEQLAKLAKKHDGFDLIVHNAGITRDKTLAKMSESFWQQTININLLSVMRINKALLNEQSINDGGSIICLSSMNGIAGQGGQTNYACSKAGIIGYVTSMKSKLASHNITINAVAPGFIETTMTAKIPFFTREMGRRMNALGQGGLPIDVANAVTFLGSESNFAISGQTLRVCGLNIIGH